MERIQRPSGWWGFYHQEIWCNDDETLFEYPKIQESKFSYQWQVKTKRSPIIVTLKN